MKRWLPVVMISLAAAYGCGGSDDGGGAGAGAAAGSSSGGAGGSASAGAAGAGAVGGSSAAGGSGAGGAGGGQSGGSAGTSGSTACFDVDSAYPAGPYGTNQGEIVANLALEGYVNLEADAISSTKPYVDYSLEALRRTGRCYAMVHVSEFF